MPATICNKLTQGIRTKLTLLLAGAMVSVCSYAGPEVPSCPPTCTNSYKNLCKNIQTKKGTALSPGQINADCKASDGSYKPTMIFTDICSGNEITVNQKGQLSCQSFQDSCTDISVGTFFEMSPNRGRGLTPKKSVSASCKKMNGEGVPTSLALPCVGSISNNDGKLVCNPPTDR